MFWIAKSNATPMISARPRSDETSTGDDDEFDEGVLTTSSEQFFSSRLPIVLETGFALDDASYGYAKTVPTFSKLISTAESPRITTAAATVLLLLPMLISTLSSCTRFSFASALSTRMAPTRNFPGVDAAIGELLSLVLAPEMRSDDDVMMIADEVADLP